MPLVDESEHQVRAYDFQLQEGLERSHLRRLTPVLEVVAHRVAGSFANLLHAPVRVEVGELEQRRFEVFANELPEPTLLTGATVSPFGGRIVLHLPLTMGFVLVELRLGGNGVTPPPERQPTEIEQRLASEMAVAALEELPSAFAGVTAFSLGTVSTVTSPMLLHAAKPTEICLIVSLRFELGEAGAHEATICIPLTVLIPILDALERIDQVQGGSDSMNVLEDIRERLLDAPVEIRVAFPDIVLCHDELSTLVPGDVVGLRQRVGAPMLLSVENILYCHVVAAHRPKRVACLVVDSEEEIRR